MVRTTVRYLELTMARTGLYKSDVKKARDLLLAQGRHPSLDAVRIALGNTGSKSTIHRYLKELEQEEGGSRSEQPALSETLLSLVQRLAAQLQSEAEDKIEAVRAESLAREQDLTAVMNGLQKETQGLRDQLQHTSERFEHEANARADLQQRLQDESVAHLLAQQRGEELQRRLAENQQHRQSLEEKHQHAREALEHYRASVKEQRDQDARRHEQQVQQLQAEIRTLQQNLVIKQEDITRLNGEGIRLIAEISHAQQDMRERTTELGRANEKLRVLDIVEERAKTLQASLTHEAAASRKLEKQLQKLDTDHRQLQIELAAAQSTIAAQKTIVGDLRHHIETIERPV